MFRVVFLACISSVLSAEEDDGLLQAKSIVRAQLNEEGELSSNLQGKTTEQCADEAEEITLDLSTDKLITNNLGGNGPDEDGDPIIRYGNAIKVGGAFHDLIVELEPGSEGTYMPPKNNHNGVSGNGFASVSVRTTYSADLKFTFVKPNTYEPVVLDKFLMKIVDIDHSEFNHEVITLYDDVKVIAPSDAEFLVEESSSSTVITSTKQGYYCDNPTTPFEFPTIGLHNCGECCTNIKETVETARRHVDLQLEGKSGFRMSFNVPLNDELLQERKPRYPEKGGRVLLFAGVRNVPKCTCVTQDIDFTNAILANNFLGGFVGTMPDGMVHNPSEQSLRFGNVGVSDGSFFDLLIESNNGDYQIPRRAKGQPNNHNGLNGKLGAISVLLDSSVDLKFTFVHQGTRQPVTLKTFDFNIFDVDESEFAKEEYVVKGFSSLTPPPKEYEFSLHIAEPTVITSQHIGYGCDNPTNPNALTEVDGGRYCDDADNKVNQAARAFSMRFEDKSSFEITFRAPLKQGVKKDFGGRVFLFSLGGSTLCQDLVPIDIVVPGLDEDP